MSTPEPELVPVAVARANLSHHVNVVSITGSAFVLTRMGKPVAALVPLGLLAAVQVAGGLEKAIDVLNKHATSPETDGAPSQKG